MEQAAEWSLFCVDAGSAYCPCYLAESGECIACSLLRGEDFCQCSWSGTCSYLNQRWARGAVKSRQEEEVEVTRTELAPNLFCLELMLQAEMARELVNPGAFLLLRALELPPQAWVPVSVVEARGEKVRVVVYVDGPKTRFLVKPASRLAVKGPFYNGVQGLAILKRVRDGLGLIIAGGVGQSTAASVAGQLLRGGNQVRACLAPGRAGLNYAADLLRALGVEVNEVSSLRREGLATLSQWLKEEPEVVFSGGPDALHRGVARVLQEQGAAAPLVTSQNAVMCCGEGLCGSCVVLTAKRRRVPRCKAQYQSEGR
ncbi:MAG TPA: hypothetical protein GXX50_01975 [Firmicutes bacterium]|nr:hypothetical protein [Bacillota bacterium]